MIAPSPAGAWNRPAAELVGHLTIDVKIGQKDLKIGCALGSFRFEVWEGGINREVWALLHSAESPSLKDGISPIYRLRMPVPFSELYDNQGEERRFIVLEVDNASRIVFYCITSTIPLPLYWVLHRLWTNNKQGESHEGRGQGIRSHSEGPGDPGPRPDEGCGPSAGAGLDGAAVESASEERQDAEGVELLEKIEKERPRLPKGGLRGLKLPRLDSESAAAKAHADEIVALAESYRADPTKLHLNSSQRMFLARIHVLRAHGFLAAGTSRTKGRKKRKRSN